MLIISVRAKRIRAVAAVLAAIFVTLGGVYFVSHRAAQPAIAEMSLTIPAPSEDARLAFLKAQGLTVDASLRTVRTVVIPESFDETWAQYNTLQQSQGFDLRAYRGRQVSVWSYPLTKSSARYANLMTCDDAIIAADVADAALDGTMEPLLNSGNV